MKNNYLITFNYLTKPLDLQDFELYQLGKIICNEDTYYPPRYHYSFYELTFVTDGEGVITTNNKPIKVKAGDIYFSDIHDVHAIESDKANPLTYDFFAFNPKNTDMQKAFAGLAQMLTTAESRVFRSARVAALISPAIAEMQNFNNQFSLYVVNSIFWQICAYTLRELVKSTPPKILTAAPDDKSVLCYRVMDYISSHIADIRSLTEIADVFNYSYNYLSTLFRETTSVKLIDFYNVQRLDYAKSFVMDNQLTLEQIAEKTNFSSAFALSKAFKKHYGTSPRVYRNNQFEGKTIATRKKSDIKSTQSKDEFKPVLYADICDAQVRKYLNATDSTRIFEILENNVNARTDKQFLSLSVADKGVNGKALFIGTDDDLRFSLDVVDGKADGGIFVPGHGYEYKTVVLPKNQEFDAYAPIEKYDDYVVQSGKFTVRDEPVRFIGLKSIRNFRDMGGYTTENKKKIRYGMIYRGGRTNEACTQDLDILKNNLKIRTEIDLRGDFDDDGQKTSALGSDCLYLKAPIDQYSCIFPFFALKTRSFDTYIALSIKKIFEALANDDNYPLMFHCNAGADRTGTLAFLINGALGVPLEDLTKDFELSTFSFVGPRLRGPALLPFEYGTMQDDDLNYVSWGDMIARMKQEYPSPDEKLSSSIRIYLKKTCDVQDDTLRKIQNLLLIDA